MIIKHVWTGQSVVSGMASLTGKPIKVIKVS
jgi:hypothetical protein